MMEIIPYGKSALLVQFEQAIDLAIHKKVVAFTAFAESIDGVTYCIPAYCSITIAFNEHLVDFPQLKMKLSQFDLNILDELTPPKSFRIPVCYGGTHGPDLAELANEKQMPPSEIIDLHTQQSYHTFMMGFIPGFPYLGTLSPPLHCKRRETPRTKVAAGSVGIAGMQTGIYPTEAPGGWQIIGKTPIPIFQAEKANPFILKMGDSVLFYAINESEFQEIYEQFSAGHLTNEDFYE